MTTTRIDTDIDLALDEPGTVRYVRPAQPAVRASWACAAGAVLLASSSSYAAWQGWLTFQSRYLPLAAAVLVLLGIGAMVFRHAADRIDAPAVEVEDPR